MLRFGLIGFVIELALTIYALVDLVQTDESRVRGFPKFAWALLIIFLPIVGAVVWLVAGKDRDEQLTWPGAKPKRSNRRGGPDDDPRFGRSPMTDSEIDAYITGDDTHIRELEDRLRELDKETFPGEKSARPDSRGGGSAQDEPGPTAEGRPADDHDDPHAAR